MRHCRAPNAGGELSAYDAFLSRMDKPLIKDRYQPEAQVRILRPSVLTGRSYIAAPHITGVVVYFHVPAASRKAVPRSVLTVCGNFHVVALVEFMIDPHS